MCFLEKGDKEEQIAKEQFEIINRLGGDFIMVRDSKDLATIISELLKPRLRITPQEVGFPLRVNEAGTSTLQWKEVKRPNDKPYFTSVFGKNTNPIDLQNAQRLFLELVQKENSILLRRGIVGLQPETKDSKLPSKTPDNDKSWLATLFKHQTRADAPGNPLDQVVLLEKLETHLTKDKLISQVVPEMVWLEVEATNNTKPNFVRWYNDWNFAAPAYHLNTDRWPFGEVANLKVWWVPRFDDIPANAMVSKEMVPGESAMLPFTVGKTQITVEGMKVEDEPIEIDAKIGAATKAKLECLVFRVEYPLDQPVWIDWPKPARMGPPGRNIDTSKAVPTKANTRRSFIILPKSPVPRRGLISFASRP